MILQFSRRQRPHKRGVSVQLTEWQAKRLACMVLQDLEGLAEFGAEYWRVNEILKTLNVALACPAASESPTLTRGRTAG